MAGFEIITGGKSEIVIKKSRFLGEVFPVHSSDEAAKLLNDTVKKYYDAKHHCFAYIIKDVNAEKASDDGEPSGTAGKQILFNLREKKINNAIAIVTRYFGGILLGTGGLTEAYRDTSLLAINNSKIAEVKEGIEYTLTINYDEYGKIDYFLKQEKYFVFPPEFSEKIKMKVMVLISNKEAFEKKVNEISAGKALFSKSDVLSYYESDNKITVL